METTCLTIKVGDIIKKRRNAIDVRVNKNGEKYYIYDHRHHLIIDYVLTGYLTLELETGKMVHVFDKEGIEVIA